MYRLLLLFSFSLQLTGCPESKSSQEPKKDFAVIAYYAGGPELVDSFAIEKLTHIIFSFGHLKEKRLSIDNGRDTATIQKLVSFKSRNPGLKVILSLGGWGGCEFCSPVFSTEAGRNEFAKSVLELLLFFKADGIDLDWEYPAIAGYPGHAYKKEDRSNFTALVKALRDTLGPNYEISFAAGGFDKFLVESIEWKEVMPLLDKVNLMSYDLVSGFSTVTGHHTPLYSSPKQKQSADNAIRWLEVAGVPLHKIIIGAAFYARVWEQVSDSNHGLFQPGKFKSFIPYFRSPQFLTTDNGYVFYRDTVAHAPYAYNASKKLFATFDDSISVQDKSRYVREKGLGGIMFWELGNDKRRNGLLDHIDRVRKE